MSGAWGAGTLLKGDKGDKGDQGDPATYSNATPQPLGATASAGDDQAASRADHVHARPTAAEVGADASGTAAAAVAAHVAAADPHPGYLTAAEGDAAYATAAQGAKADTAVQPAALATKADLVNGLVPSSQLPGFVDDVIEGANLAAFPATGESGKLYVALDTGKTYRWSGSAYVEISASPGSTDAVPEGANNLYHTTQRAAAAAPVQSVAGKTGTVTLAKGDVGLGNVDNTSDANKPISNATQTALDGKVGTSDSRLTDSREWSADTISQAEAETGTATTRRAFTALRVFQAIASWWSGSAAKTKLDGIQDGAQVNAATNLSYNATTRNLASSTGSPAVLPLFGSSAAGLVPASGGGTSNFLRADGTFAAPPGGTPGGINGQFQYNNNGVFGGLSTLTADGSGNLTLSARLTNSYNAAASAPAKLFSGTWFTGGTSTTTKPHVLIEPSGTTSTSWNTAGTGFGVNAPAGFLGDVAWFGTGGSNLFRINPANGIHLNTPTYANSNFIAGGGQWFLAPTAFTFRSDFFIGSSAATYGSPADVVLRRDAVGVWAYRNGTSAQSKRIYNTFTSDTNFERAKIEWVSNILRIGTEKGTAGGTARDMELQTDGTTRITVKADGAILFSGMPTTNPNVAGQLWNDGGTLKISAG